jgi:hypothetical protein
MATQDDYIKTALRLPRGLHAKLLASADATGKSMNSEIIARVESSFAYSGESTALITAIAQLNLSLAQAQFERGKVEFRLNVLAQYLHEAAGLIKHLADGSDTGSLQSAETFAAQARPHIGKTDALLDGLQGQIEELMKATSEVLRTTPPEPRQDERGSPIYRFPEPDCDGEPPEPSKQPQRRINPRGTQQRAEAASREVVAPELPKVRRGVSGSKKA